MRADRFVFRQYAISLKYCTNDDENITSIREIVDLEYIRTEHTYERRKLMISYNMKYRFKLSSSKNRFDTFQHSGIGTIIKPERYKYGKYVYEKLFNFVS